MIHNNPIAFERVLAMVGRLGLAPGDRVLDVGCGAGALLAALADRGHPGRGVDVSAEEIAAARLRIKDLPVELVCGDARQVPLGEGYGLACCIGSDHAFGEGGAALAAAIKALGATVRASGHLVLGVLHRQAPLPPEYAALLGDDGVMERTHLQVVQACEAGGFDVRDAITASPAEWDAFEWAHFRRRLDAASTADAAAKARAWRDAYLRWGRASMGFGLYALRSRG